MHPNRQSNLALLLACVVFTLTAEPVTATRVSIWTARDLIAGAPIVVKGLVLKLEAAPETDIAAFPGFENATAIQAKRAVVSVEYTLKGDPQEAKVEVLFLHGPGDYCLTAPEVGTTYLLFLKKSPFGLRLFDPQDGIVPVPKGTSGKMEGEPIDKLRMEFERSLGTHDRSFIYTALLGLASVGNAQSLQKIKPYTASPDGAIRVSAAEACLALGEWQYAETMVQVLEGNYARDKTFTPPESAGRVGTRLDRYLTTVTDTNAAPLYLKLLKQSKTPYVRVLLAGTLASMHCSVVLPYLLEMLHDEDRDTAYSAYASIMEMRDLPQYSSVKFEQEKASIIAELEQWAASQKKDTQ